MSEREVPGLVPVELKRCYTKMDFTRERGFLRQHHQVRETGGNRRRSSAMPSNRGKPTLELYRPPNVRADVLQNGVFSPNPRLNVHAKEFTMKHGDITTSRSSMNLPSTLNNHHQQHHHMQQRTGHVLQSSKSSGNILHQLHQSKSTGNVLHHSTVQGPRVHFQLEPTHRTPPSEPPPSQPQVLQMEMVPKSPLKSLSASEMKTVLADSSGNKFQSSVAADSSVGKLLRLPSSVLPGGLKRSKSLGAADMMRQNPSSYSVAKEAPDLGPFPPEVHAAIRHAVEDPNKLSARTLMELVRQIMDRVVSSVSYSLPAAKLCITIIEKEHKETFLESLLNTCRQWCQERDKILKQGGGTTRFCAFMQFLNEMYCELKRRQLQLKTQYDGVPPGLVLLTLLYECCQECLKPPNSQGETDSLFFVLTSVGRDFEQELPNKLTQLIASVRDTFLMVHNVPSIKKTLLQLIELRAARWQLSASAVMYYTTQQ